MKNCTYHERPDIKTGDIVKVSIQHERLWCEVKAYSSKICFLSIYNLPAYTRFHGLNQGDTLIMPRNTVEKIAPRGAARQ